MGSIPIHHPNAAVASEIGTANGLRSRAFVGSSPTCGTISVGKSNGRIPVLYSGGIGSNPVLRSINTLRIMEVHNATNVEGTGSNPVGCSNARLKCRAFCF